MKYLKMLFQKMLWEFKSRKYKKELSEVLDIALPKISVCISFNENGAYCRQKDSIMLKPQSFDKMLFFLAHELRHKWQHCKNQGEFYNNYKLKEDFMEKDNVGEDVAREMYDKQFEEVDADTFAAIYMCLSQQKHIEKAWIGTVRRWNYMIPLIINRIYDVSNEKWFLQLYNGKELKIHDFVKYDDLRIVLEREKGSLHDKLCHLELKEKSISEVLIEQFSETNGDILFMWEDQENQESGKIFIKNETLTIRKNIKGLYIYERCAINECSETVNMIFRTKKRIDEIDDLLNYDGVTSCKG